MSKAFYPGSFDPVTNGHINLIKRAANIFDALTIGVYASPFKKTLFSADERVRLLKDALGELPRVEVIAYSRLTVDVARERQATVLLRGLRIGSDFEYEREMALSNRALEKRIDTLFLMSSLEYQFVSSSRVKEIAQLGGDVSAIVPPNVYKILTERIRELKV